MRFQPFAGTFAQGLALFLVAAGSTATATADAPRPAAPVCAFLDPERIPRAALLEAKLLADPSATWVERAIIDKVLKEQSLQAAFGPQGGSDRVRLGKVLKADLLVLVRPVKGAKEPLLEVVVSDTARGLRLTVRVVPVTADASADVTALRDAVRAGLKKFQEHIREVVAVPPFASTNLAYEYDYLKGAYAKLVEQAALANPGVVVVELEEAEAIAREIKLADPGATVKRMPALYLLGEFRHQGRGAAVRVALQFRATRGGQAVGTPVAQTVTPGEAPATLHRWVADRLTAGTTGPAPALDPKAEAKQLADLSRSRQRVGDWADALALLEASLLLDPNQPDLDADAMAVLRARMLEMLGRGSKEIDLLRRLAPLHRRGMDHMETLVASGARLPRFAGLDGVRGGRMFNSPFPFPYRPAWFATATQLPDPPAVRELTQELLEERQAICRRLLPLIVKDGTAHEVVTFSGVALWDLSSEERYAARGRLILQYQDFPAMTAAVDTFLYLAPQTFPLADLPIYRTLLDRLEKEGNAGVRAAAARARQKLPRIEKEMGQWAERLAREKRLAEQAARNPPRPPDWGRLSRQEKAARIDKLTAGGPLYPLHLQTTSPEDDWFLDHLRGVIAAGRGTDVFWATGFFLRTRTKDPAARPRPGYGSGTSGPVLLMMTTKGQLRRVWDKPGAPDTFSAVCFDGRYVWAATERSQMAPALFLLDPLTAKVVEVTADDGLPQPPADLVRDPRRRVLSLRLAPLQQGRVCVTGGFGRGWVGVATFDPGAQKATVKVIHEARELPRQGEKEEELWQNRNLAFTPVYAHTLRGSPGADGKTPCRVLIGRAPQSAGINDNLAYFGAHPLVIDPDGPTVEVLRDSLVGFAARDWAVAADGALLVAYHPPSAPDKVRLARVVYPGTVHDLGPLAFPRAHGLNAVGMCGDRLHFTFNTPGPGGSLFFATTCWSADLDGRHLRKVADDLLHIRALAQSAHYGLVAWCDLYPGNALCAFRVSDTAGAGPAARGP